MTTKIATILLILIGSYNSALSFLGNFHRSPEFLALLSPYARVFVQPGFFYRKSLLLEDDKGRKTMVSYNAVDDPPSSRMLYMVSQFSDKIPQKDLEQLVNFEIFQNKSKIVPENTKIKKVSLVWQNNRKWDWQCP